MTFALAFNDGYRLSRLQHLVKKLETHVMETIGGILDEKYKPEGAYHER